MCIYVLLPYPSCPPTGKACTLEYCGLKGYEYHMRYESVVSLIESDQNAKSYFNSLPDGCRAAVLAHGAGINTLEELKHFASILEKQG